MVNAFYLHAKQELSKNGFENAMLEARLITCEAFKITQNELLLHNSSIGDQKALEKAEEMLAKRLKNVPLQYILGKWEFYGLMFYVGNGVLIPRADTETLVDTALEIIGDKQMTVLDLCSGSGCIAVAVAKNSNAKVFAVELSDEALVYLNKNNELNHAGIKIIKGDVFDKNTVSEFSDIDMILCNPPYLKKSDMENLQKEVQFEPKSALFGGDDGLEYYRKIARLWKSAVKSGGYMIFEIGAGQEFDVCEILKENGFYIKKCVKDLGNITRVVCAQQ